MRKPVLLLASMALAVVLAGGVALAVTPTQATAPDESAQGRDVALDDALQGSSP